MASEPSVAIIILTWNNEKDIVDCLNSVKKLDYKNFKVVVVDNNSSDSTTDLVSENFPEVDLLKLDKNYYFTTGNNKGFEYALEKYNPYFLTILNPDTIVEPDLLKVLIVEIEKDETIAGVGPKIKFLGGVNEGKINSAGLFYDNFRQAYDIGFAEEDNGQFDHTKEVFGVTGTCILFRSGVIKKTKGFWGILKMYTDEVELFIRVRKLGLKAVYTGKTTVWHKYMQSTNQAKNMKVEKLKLRNWLLIALRHYSLRGKLAMLVDVIRELWKLGIGVSESK